MGSIQSITTHSQASSSASKFFQCFPATSPPAAETFPQFPRLPTELQIIVFQQFTSQWILDETPEPITSHSFGAYVEIDKERHPTVEDPKGMSLCGVWPSTLWVDRFARGVAYDTLCYFQHGKPKLVYPPGPVDLYVEEYTWRSGEQYGLRIQDFRRPGLQDRVAEEEKRIELTREEDKKGEISAWVWVDGVFTFVERPFVILPGNCLHPVYKHD